MNELNSKAQREHLRGYLEAIEFKESGPHKDPWYWNLAFTAVVALLYGVPMCFGWLVGSLLG